MKSTDVFIVADLSGSMRGTKEQKLREMVQELVKTLADEEVKGNQVFNVTLVPFSSTATWSPTRVASAIRPTEIAALNTAYPMGSQTALRDAIGYTIEKSKPDAVTLISVFSDGEENASYAYSAARLKVKIAELDQTGNFTLTFAGPESARQMLVAAGMPADNFRAWSGSEKEMAAVAADTKSSYEGYIQARSVGQTRSLRFYADTAQVTDPGLRAMTKEVQPSEIRKVTRHMDGRAIADFYGSKFNPGHHYYELIKPEYLGDDKDLIVLIKDKGEYRQGSRALRTLLGLPETGRIRIHPDSGAGKYQIFIQSTSLNRKMVEGQTMLTV